MEEHDPSLQTLVLVERADLVAGRGFRLEVGVADQRAHAAAGQYAVGFVGLVDARRLERFAGAALDYPVVGEVEDAVGSGAEFAAEGVVVVPAAAKGNVQVAEGELVLQVERLLVDFGV